MIAHLIGVPKIKQANIIVKVCAVISWAIAVFSAMPAVSTTLNYDLVYVRYPIVDTAKRNHQKYVSIPQGERAYPIAPGADLMLLHADGSERILVDCDKCSVMDPFISYDGKTVYYSLIEEPKKSSASWIFKIKLDDPDYLPIQLTFDDGFDSTLYAGNRNQSKKYNQQFYRSIRDMAPVPLADGRLMFTSNRSALTALNPGTNAVIGASVQQLYVMDDHDGELITGKLANLTRLEAGTIHLAQHPIQLKDGRILFSSWQDVGHKYHYAMTNLMLVNPDGSNLTQFTEPHDHHKMVEHFITQLSDEQVISGIYYPSFDYGYGILMRYPIDPPGPDWIRGSIEQRYTYGAKVSFREFDRKGALTITPHTTPRDIPAPNLSGKYSMPSAGPNGDLLVAYSKGSVNHFGAVCGKKNQCEPLRSGIYLIPDASTNMINDPKDLIMIKDDIAYNEIWPRAVVPYKDIYGQDTPDLIPPTSIQNSQDERLKKGEAAALMGTSSMYNREELDGGDIFQARSSRREIHDGNWTIQGAEAGVFTNSDIYAVRIVSSPAKPYTNPLSKYGENKQDWKASRPYLQDQRLERVVARYTSFHNERWEILGEFPLTYKHKLDPQGNPDSSWLAKVPAETPLFIQAIDRKGMTLNSELTWRALKSGEKRADCGGCHSHSIESVKFEQTEAGKQAPIKNVAGVTDDDPRIQNALWDLTQGSVPLLDNNGKVEFVPGTSFGVEFTRDIVPILNKHCVDCHTNNGSASSLVLDGSNGFSPYLTLARGKGVKPREKYRIPQISRYIRSPQARQSLLTWIIYGERLDGRTNDTRKGDIDYPENHPVLNLSEDEKRLVARWIDLGGARNLTPTDGFGYTEDVMLPVINLLPPEADAESNLVITAGFIDVGSGLNLASAAISINAVSIPDKEPSLFAKLTDLFSEAKVGKVLFSKSALGQHIDKHHVLSLSIPNKHIDEEQYILVSVSIEDKVGNKNIASLRISTDNLSVIQGK